MSKIIYLEGSRAVGKTTLLKNIKRRGLNINVIDGYARKEFMFDTTRFQEFILNEKLYFACDLAQYDVLKEEDSPTIIVKGPYTDVYYAERYMEKVFPMKQIQETELYPYIKNIKEHCVPDGIIYLDASLETIQKRYASDDHRRRTMDEFLNNWLDDFAHYFKSNPLTKIIDTNEKDEQMVYYDFMKMIEDDIWG